MAASYTQDGRPMAVSTAAGKDALLLEQFQGTEALSELFSFQLELLATPDHTIDFAALVGQPATVALRPRTDQPVRHINGIVSRFSQGGVVRGPNGGHTFTRYSATLVPALWRLTKTHRSRIFQQKSVPDILKTVLEKIDTQFRLAGTYEKRDYCSQYQETDFAFASRLMEEEGIFYYFAHTDGGHTMVLGDAPDAHNDIPGETTLLYDDVTGPGQVTPEDRVRGWHKTQELQSGKVTLWDHCFELPPQTLEAVAAIQNSVAVGTVAHKLAVGGSDGMEVYDYPGRYAQRFDGVDPGGGERASDVQNIFQDNKRTAGLRMQQEAARAVAVEAASTVRTLTAGHKFSLTRHYDADGKYVVTRVEHTGDLRASYHGRESDGTPEYVNRFGVLPAALPFRPQPATPKGRINGVQAGTVVGPKGEEIFTDKYGRVKVQFRWDRDGENDAGSSCWVRVGTMWAGKQWGMVHIPRIGQEVLVSFEEGDPDRPIIVGSVYNAEQMPPYTLPDHRTRSGIKSRSTLNGTPDHFNELYFEDKKGEELIYFHAEKDFDQVVENNQTLKVGFREGGNSPDKGNQEVTVFNNQSVTVGKPHPDGTDPYEGNALLTVWNDRHITIGAGEDKCKDGNELVSIWNNQHVYIGDGKGKQKDGSQTMAIWKDRAVALKTGHDSLVLYKGDQTETLKMGNRTVTLEMGNDTLTLKMGNRTTKLSLGADKTEALQSITLKVGTSKLVVDQTGVSIEGMMVTINGKVQTDIKGLMTQVSGTAMCKLGGGITMIG